MSFTKIHTVLTNTYVESDCYRKSVDGQATTTYQGGRCIFVKPKLRSKDKKRYRRRWLIKVSRIYNMFHGSTVGERSMEKRSVGVRLVEAGSTAVRSKGIRSKGGVKVILQ